MPDADLEEAKKRLAEMSASPDAELAAAKARLAKLNASIRTATTPTKPPAPKKATPTEPLSPQRYDEQGRPLPRVPLVPAKPHSIYAAPTPAPPNALQRGLGAVGEVLSVPSGVVKAAALPLMNATQRQIAKSGFGKGPGKADIASQEKTAALPFAQRVQALKGQDWRTLGQTPETQARRLNLDKVGNPLERAFAGVGELAGNMATDPLTWAMFGGGALGKKAVEVATAKGGAKVGANVAKAANVANKGVQAGFTGQQLAGAASDFQHGDARSIAQGLINLGFGLLGAAHVAGVPERIAARQDAQATTLKPTFPNATPGARHAAPNPPLSQTPSTEFAPAKPPVTPIGATPRLKAGRQPPIPAATSLTPETTRGMPKRPLFKTADEAQAAIDGMIDRRGFEFDNTATTLDFKNLDAQGGPSFKPTSADPDAIELARLYNERNTLSANEDATARKGVVLSEKTKKGPLSEDELRQIMQNIQELQYGASSGVQHSAKKVSELALTKALGIGMKNGVIDGRAVDTLADLLHPSVQNGKALVDQIHSFLTDIGITGKEGRLIGTQTKEVEPINALLKTPGVEQTAAPGLPTEPIPVPTKPAQPAKLMKAGKAPTHIATLPDGTELPVRMEAESDAEFYVRDTAGKSYAIPKEAIRPIGETDATLQTKPLESAAKEDVRVGEGGETGTRRSGGQGQSDSIPLQETPGARPAEGQTQAPQEGVGGRNKYGEPDNAVDDFSKMRMRDIEAADERLGGSLGLPERGVYKKSSAERNKDAFENYDQYLDEARRHDVAKSGALGDQATRVARAHVNALNRKMQEAATPAEANAYLAEIQSLSRKLHQSGTEASSRLRMQAEFVSDATDAAAAAMQLNKMTEGKASQEAQRTVQSLSAGAKVAQEVANANIEKRAASAEPAAKETLSKRAAKVKAEAPAYTREGWGSKNKTTTREQAQEARDAITRALSRPSEVLPGIPNFTDALPHLVTLGKFHYEAGAKAFGEWVKAMQSESGDSATKGELETIWAGMRHEKAQDGKTFPSAPSAAFTDRLAKRLGREGVNDFLEGVADENGNPAILDKLLNGKSLTADEKTQLATAWDLARPTRNRTAPPKPDATLAEVLKEAKIAERQQVAVAKKAAKVLTPEERLAGKQETLKRALEKRIAALEERLHKQDFAARPKGVGTPDTPEMTVLKERLKTLRERYDAAKPKVGMSMSAKQRFAERSLAGQIDRLTKRIANNDFSKPAKSQLPETPVMTRMKSQLAKLRERYNAIKPDERVGKTLAGAEAKLGTLGMDRPSPLKPTLPETLVAAREYAQGARSLDSFARNMKTKYGNLDDKFMQELFIKAASEYRRNSTQLDHIKRTMNQAIQKEVFRLSPAWKKGLILTGDALQLPTALVASFDYSGLLRQGGMLSINDPKAASRGAKLMVQAGANAELAQEINDRIRIASPNAVNGNYEAAKIEFTDLPGAEHQGQFTRQEEQFRSALAEKIPGVGRGVVASNRAYATVLNSLRGDGADRLIKSFQDRERSPLAPSELEDIGRVVNVFSGRGDIQSAKGKALADSFSIGIFSPRYVVSRMQAVTLQPLRRASTGATRKLVAKEYARYLSRVGLVAGLGALAMKAYNGDAMETDSRSSDFLKIRLGDVEIDPYAGNQQIVTFLSRMLPTRGQNGWSEYTKSQQGELQDLRHPEGALSPTTGSVASRFVRSKFNPTLGTATNLASPSPDSALGTNYLGKPVDYVDVGTSLSLPFAAQDIIEAWRKDGLTASEIGNLVAMFGLSTVGLGANVRDRAQEERERRAKKKAGGSKSSGIINLPDTGAASRSVEKTMRWIEKAASPK